MSEYDPKVLDLYTDFLITSFGPVTATGLSRILAGQVSHDQVSRMLLHSHLDNKSLWKRVKPLIRQIQSEAGVMIIDDCVAEKPHMEENAVIQYHYDHSVGRTVKGINFVSCCYETPVQDLSICVPVQVEVIEKTELYENERTGELRYRSKKTKNEVFQDLLRAVQQNQIPFSYVLCDVWFSSAENMTFIRTQLKKHFVMPIKSNRLVRLLAEGDTVEHHPGQKKVFQAVETLQLTEDQTYRAEIKGLGVEVLLLRHVYKNADGSVGVVFLVSSDLTLSGTALFDLQQRRWKIEPYHKSLKQNASLMQSPARTAWTQRNHVFASLLGYVKLETLKLQGRVNHFALRTRIYTRAVQAAWEELRSLREQFKSHASLGA